MPVEFRAESDPSELSLAKVAALAPANPFLSPEYAQSKLLRGHRVWLLIEQRDTHVLSGCTAFMTSYRLSRRLEIPSLHIPVAPNAFWEGLIRFCRSAQVWELTINSFASAAARIPDLSLQANRCTRREYLVDLSGHDLWDRLSNNHKRNVKRSLKVGMQMRRTTDMDACREHDILRAESMGRRQTRGEAVTSMVLPERHSSDYVKTGAGEVFQAVLGGEVLSSVLVLVAERGAYYHSAGTSPKGMTHGASHFLIHEISKTLQARSLELFNLGGANDASKGLQRFKLGFGSTSVSLEAAEFFLAPRLTRDVVSILRRVRRAFFP